MSASKKISRKATVILEDVKEEILTHLDKVQRTQSAWYSANMIRTGVHRNPDRVLAALYELATEGFLNIRHNPEAETRLLYRLRRDNPNLTAEVREKPENLDEIAPIEGTHTDWSTPDYAVECPACASDLVTGGGFKHVEGSNYPVLRWNCQNCGNQFWTSDTRDTLFSHTPLTSDTNELPDHD